MGCRVEWNVEYNEWDNKGNVDQNSKWLKRERAAELHINAADMKWNWLLDFSLSNSGDA